MGAKGAEATIHPRDKLLLPFNKTGFLLFVLTFFLGIVLYWDGLVEVVSRWESQEEYSHGYLIPFVSLFILWEKRNQILSDYQSFSWWGVPFVFIALGLLIIGEISALYLLVHYSYLLFLFGISLALLGTATKHTWVPITLLGFAIPLPYFIEVILTAELQLISSRLGVEFLRVCRIPVFLSGNIIDLGDFKLQVVEACSGLRYLFPLMSLGFIAAYFYRASFWKKLVLFTMTVPITIFMNSFRIAVTGFLVENWGVEFAEGFLHDFEGWIIFMACGVLLLLVVQVLELFTTKLSLGKAFAKPQQVDERASDGRPPLKISPVLVVIIPLLVGAIVGIQLLDKRQEDVILHETLLAAFPTQFDEWRGSHAKIDNPVARKLQFTDYVMVDYKNASHQPVNFYIAYYNSQRKGVSPHSPKVCIPGGGWEITNFRRKRIDDMPVNRAIVRKGAATQLVYYWFEERGEVVANEYHKKWLLFRDALLLNRTDGSLLRATTPLGNGETIAEADERIVGFIRQIHEHVGQFLPGRNLEVEND